MDANEINLDVLKKIKSEKVLEQEYDHINKLIQQHNADIERTSLWFLGIILASLGILIKYIIDFGIKLLDNPHKYTSAEIQEAVPWALNLAVGLGGGAILLALIFLTFRNITYRKFLITLKEEIIVLLNTEGK
jgi:hypothetical protein